MKIQELRIGNYVNHNSEWCYKGEDVYNFQWETNDWKALSECTLFIENIEPILLNQKWLLDFGFQRYGFVDKPTQFRFKDRLIVCRDGFLHDYGTSVKIEYVHQLQNLYFALTGEELIYKKEKL